MPGLVLSTHPLIRVTSLGHFAGPAPSLLPGSGAVHLSYYTLFDFLFTRLLLSKDNGLPALEQDPDLHLWILCQSFHASGCISTTWI